MTTLRDDEIQTITTAAAPLARHDADGDDADADGTDADADDTDADADGTDADGDDADAA